MLILAFKGFFHCYYKISDASFYLYYYYLYENTKSGGVIKDSFKNLKNFFIFFLIYKPPYNIISYGLAVALLEC